MQPDQRKPSVFRIVESDYWALLGLLAPIAGWGIYVTINILGFVPNLNGGEPIPKDPGSLIFLGIAIIFTAVGILLLLWRIRSFQILFDVGREIQGKITDIWFFRDRGRVEYKYTFQGRRYNGGSALHKTKRTASLRKGEEVLLIVDPDHPERAFIRELYV